MTVPSPEPRVARFEEMAYGLFIHWGLYSLLGRGEWVMHRDQIPHAEYARLAGEFSAAKFDARGIARMAREAGMKYITLTTRHHEGFSLYDTRGLDPFDAPHSAAKRDLVAEFVEGCRAEGIVPFFYHTTLDWRWDSVNCPAARFNEYLDYLCASVEILCRHYGPIGGLWFDGNWSRTDLDWKTERLYATIRRHQPDAMIINNTGMEHRGAIESPEVDSVTFEQELPRPVNREGHSKYISGEMCQTMNRHWGIGLHDFKYMSPAQLIENLCACRKVGANYLLNVGPRADGEIPAYEQAALCRAGDWVRMHEDPVRKGKPTAFSCEGRDFVLEAGGKLYYFVFNLGPGGLKHVSVAEGTVGPRAIKGLPGAVRRARWLDNGEELRFLNSPLTEQTIIECTGYPYGTQLVVRVAEIEVDSNGGPG